MPKRTPSEGQQNLIGERLTELRQVNALSQRKLAQRLQDAGYSIEKNAITRIETNKRYVTDIELVAFSKVFGVSLDYLVKGEDDRW